MRLGSGLRFATGDRLLYLAGMKSPQSMLAAMTVALLPVLAACATDSGSAAGANGTCADLNVAIGETSKALSAAAISRGKIDRLNVPFWLPGGTKAVSALKDRQSRKIDNFENELSQQRQQRKARCTRP